MLSAFGEMEKRVRKAKDKAVKQAAALRVMNDLGSGRIAEAGDLDLVRSSALQEERDLDIDDLALRVAKRCSYFL